MFKALNILELHLSAISYARLTSIKVAHAEVAVWLTTFHANIYAEQLSYEDYRKQCIDKNLIPFAKTPFALYKSNKNPLK